MSRPTSPEPDRSGIRLDAISIEVQWNRLISIMDEVDIAVVRTAFSTIVSESRDFAVIMLDRDGRGLAQSRLSSPAFTVTLPMTAKHLLAEFPVSALEPGDVLITNDPWLGSGHLPDLSIITPVFYKGEVVAFMGCVAHIADIGGRLDFFEARDLFEEGLQIPPSKLYCAGRENEQLFRLIAANVRVPDMVIGDIRAIMGAERLGGERLADFLEDHGGGPGFQAVADEILGRSEAAMRKALAELPDGEWECALDADGFRTPLHIEVRLQKRGDRIEADFEGSSVQFSDASINCVPNTTFADTYYPLKCSLTPELPNNEGLLKPLSVTAPAGSVFNPRRPCAVRSRSKTSFHIHMAVYGALAEVIPDRVQAGSGSFWAITLHGNHPDDGKVFNVHVLPNGGKGATARSDGLPTIAFPYNGTVTPVEITENQAPVQVEYKRLVPDSGGPGRWRGGLGQELAMRVTSSSPLIASLRPDKVDHPPPGIRGGEEGMRGDFRINGERVSVEPKTLARGDVYAMRLPGGGGYGDPGDRPVDDVLRDVVRNAVSVEAARREYGVEVDLRTGKAHRPDAAEGSEGGTG